MGERLPSPKATGTLWSVDIHQIDDMLRPLAVCKRSKQDIRHGNSAEVDDSLPIGVRNDNTTIN